MKYFKITDFIELDVLQKIQDNYAKAVGSASITVDYRGQPITRKSNFSTFCSKMRENPQFRERCYLCDAHAGLQSVIKGSTYIYLCHSGLTDFSAAIKIQDQYLGAVLGGQVRIEDERNLTPIMPINKDFLKDPQMSKLYYETPVVTYDKVVAVSDMMHTITNYLVEKQYLNKEKEEINKNRLMMLEQEREKIQFEKTLNDTKLKLLYSRINSNFMFHVLNTLARMSYLENAKKTEEIIYDFTDMMRYSLKRTQSRITSLGDEIDYISKYLKVVKFRLGERIDYTIDVPEKFYNIACPFMVMLPIVENFCQYVVECREDTGRLDVKAFEKNGDLHVVFKDNGNGMSQRKIDSILSGRGYFNRENASITLYDVHKRIEYIFGDEHYGLEIESENQPGKGLSIRVKLPLGKEGYHFV